MTRYKKVPSISKAVINPEDIAQPQQLHYVGAEAMKNFDDAVKAWTKEQRTKK